MFNYPPIYQPIFFYTKISLSKIFIFTFSTYFLAFRIKISPRAREYPSIFFKIFERNRGAFNPPLSTIFVRTKKYPNTKQIGCRKIRCDRYFSLSENVEWCIVENYSQVCSRRTTCLLLFRDPLLLR